MIAASCSPEGEYMYNKRLSMARSSAVIDALSNCMTPEFKSCLKASSVPENWRQFRQLVQNDSVLSPGVKDRIISMTSDMSDPDRVEGRLSQMKEYRYLRERIYPYLRSVSFDFYLHRKGMVKDTVHTTVVDTAYMSGVYALKNMDYNKAVEYLRPYADYNSALAFLSAGYNHSALNILESLSSSDAKVCYLMAMVLSRLGEDKRALKYYTKSLELAPFLEFRANLDPEMSELVKRKSKSNYD